MKVEKETHLKIKIKGDDINKLKSALDKIVCETKEVGFKNKILTESEIKILIQLSESLVK